MKLSSTLGVAVVFTALAVAACGSAGDGAPGEDVGSSSSEALTTVPPGPNKVYGIDVSHFQGSLNWAAEKAQGRLFAVASVGDGLYQDPNFATNWAGMKAAGVIRGAYQFFEPGIDPIQQADILIAKVGKLGDGDLPATIDVEATGNQSPATVAARVGQWLARVEAGTGRKPMIYTGPYFWQDHVSSTAYGAYPLWIADYGVSAPKLPAPWGAFKIWQYSDSGGSLDLDLFNGTLAQLQAFARPPIPPNAPPRGSLDSATCTGITGWAQDPSVPTQAIGVHLSFNAAAGAPGAELVPIIASTPRSDLCVPLGSCNHAFTASVPRGLMDSKAHSLFAYAIDSAGAASVLLTHAPRSFTCAPPEPPLAPPAGIKRHIASPAVLTTWKLSTQTDLAHYPQARVDAYALGDPFPATPSVLISDDGAPEVWLVDGGKRRHVVSQASMAAWRFPAPKKTPAATIKAMPLGPDWRATPFLLEGTTADVYALDLAPTTPPGTESPGADPTDPNSTSAEVPTSPAEEAPADAPSANSSGCSVVASRPTNSAMAGAMALAIACALVARRRRAVVTSCGG